VRQILRIDVERGLAQTHEAWRTEAIVEVLFPLVPERARGQRAYVAGRHPGNARVTPEAQARDTARDDDGIVADAIDGEQRALELVLGPASVVGRAEPRIAPSAGPRAGHRIDLRVRVRLLVADERAARGVRDVDAVLETRFPESGVAAEERQVHAGVA